MWPFKQHMGFKECDHVVPLCSDHLFIAWGQLTEDLAHYHAMMGLPAKTCPSSALPTVLVFHTVSVTEISQNLQPCRASVMSLMSSGSGQADHAVLPRSLWPVK